MQALIPIRVEEKLIRFADFYFEMSDYLSALPLYLKLNTRYPERTQFIYRTGICYLYKSNEKHKSIEYLEKVRELEPKTKDLYFYLGRAYHMNYQFEKALEYFNLVLKKEQLPHQDKQFIKRLIENCEHGKKIIKNPLTVKIENIGIPINTDGYEYVPVISADESVLIYTYSGKKSIGGLQFKYGKGEYFEDIYISYKLGDNWLEPESISDNINTRDHDACMALSADGQKLLIYKSSEKTSGDIFLSELNDNLWSKPTRLPGGLNTKDWEGSACFFPDNNSLYFSSDKPGGYGGRDIYKSLKNEDGSWGEAVNLGSTINTPYNDDAPFIHPDGKILYFSSEGHSSIGGYDIFYSTIEQDGTWSTPENIGYPINTTADDIYYIVSANGKRGYYSSGRLGGYGLHDIYVVHLGKSAKQHALMLIKGEISVNDEAVEAKIRVEYLPNYQLPDADTLSQPAQSNLSSDGKTHIQGIYKSNSATGNYLISLPAGNNYQIKYEVEDFPPYKKNINTTGIDTFKTVVIDVKFYSENYTPNPIKFDGKVLYSEKPPLPATNLTILIFNKNDSLLDETISDKKGYFRFSNLPYYHSYIINIDANDPNLVAEAKTIIIALATHAGLPKEGLLINETLTDKDGNFRLENPYIKTFRYSELPADILDLDTLYLANPPLYKEVMARYGTKSANDLIFRVQIGAYYNPENFNYSTLTSLGEVKSQLLDDGITRFTMGNFKTLREAEDFKQKVIQRDIVDAFTLIFYKGKRRLLAEVVANDFYAE